MPALHDRKNTPDRPSDLWRWFLWALDVTHDSPQQRDQARRCFHELMHLWTEPTRVYHSLVEHLMPLIEHIVTHDFENINIWGGRAVIVAAFYHDAILLPGRSDSENVEASALLCKSHLAAIFPQDPSCVGNFPSDCVAEILSTDYSRPENPQANTLRQFDLLGLADPWKFYVAKGQMLDEEATLKGGDPMSLVRIQGQIRWICALLTQPRIYATRSEFWDMKELHARNNLGRDLAQLVTPA